MAAQRKKSDTRRKGTSKRKKAAPTRKKSARRTTRRSASRRPTDLPVIVYIHGIGAHPPEDEFKRAWDLALFGRDMRDRTRMAYWSDILHGDADERRRKERKKGVRARREPESLEAAELLREANVDPDNEKAVAFVEQLARSLAEPGVVRGERRDLGGLRTKALPLPGFLRRPIARRFMHWFIKDTAAYFFDRRVRRRIKDRLVQQIPTDGEPFILVSHSQGTIVAFEVLTELEERAEAALFATAGSPLGIREVQDLLEDDGFRLRTPGRV